MSKNNEINLDEINLDKMTYRSIVNGSDAWAMRITKSGSNVARLFHFLTAVFPKDTKVDVREATDYDGKKVLLISVGNTERRFIEHNQWVYVLKDNAWCADFGIITDKDFQKSFTPWPKYPTRVVLMAFDEKGELASYQEHYNVSVSGYNIQSIEEPCLVAKFKFYQEKKEITINGCIPRARSTLIDPEAFKGDIRKVAFRKDPTKLDL